MAVLFLSAKNLDTIQRPRSGLFYMALAGITSGAGATFMLFASSKAPVAVVAPVASINPLIALILSAIFIRGIEVFSPRVVVGTFLVVAGVILVVVGSDL
jgi:drug/metabolite transporter (DMT)-like permease